MLSSMLCRFEASFTELSGIPYVRFRISVITWIFAYWELFGSFRICRIFSAASGARLRIVSRAFP